MAGFCKGCAGQRRFKNGFILAYVLVALGIASLALSFISRSGNAASDNRRMVELREEIAQQASLIRAKIMACAIQHPSGNNGLGYRLPFPAAPGSGLVAELICPGIPDTNKDLWTGVDGIYMPRTLPGFSEWQYVHDATSVRISISSTAGGAVNTAALNNVALKIGSQASVSSDKLTIVIAN